MFFIFQFWLFCTIFFAVCLQFTRCTSRSLRCFCFPSFPNTTVIEKVQNGSHREMKECSKVIEKVPHLFSKEVERALSSFTSLISKQLKISEKGTLLYYYKYKLFNDGRLEYMLQMPKGLRLTKCDSSSEHNFSYSYTVKKICDCGTFYFIFSEKELPSHAFNSG